MRQKSLEPCSSRYRPQQEVAQFGRVSDLEPGGRRFESSLPDCTIVQHKHISRRPDVVSRIEYDADTDGEDMFRP